MPLFTLLSKCVLLGNWASGILHTRKLVFRHTQISETKEELGGYRKRAGIRYFGPLTVALHVYWGRASTRTRPRYALRPSVRSPPDR
jgi:hypothetical protein